ncbi:MAG: type I DNA topoisomerase [Thermodesulfobacteriota bacterium]|nr:type I DNA topoisomerase [Thermodesulfobacteriota bacterium]
MSKNLLIVESPAKARTLQKYLGPDFKIMASVGHLKDLPVKKLGVAVEHNFEPEYAIIKGKDKILKSLKKAGKDTEKIYLAPDPDREGEAIAWHIAQELKTDNNKIFRVLFNELTEKAIRKAVASPQPLNKDKFESQQARRILDRLVGYQISPLLWPRVKRGLSAGRVQSVAVKMICDREREIYAFESQEYWSLTAHLESEEPPSFKARLLKYEDKKIDLKNESQTQKIVSHVKDQSFRVSKVSKKKKKKNPPPPFITSLLQQEASRKLGFSAKKTMLLAQNLYEGIELGKRGQIGLITYMRTDSFRVSDDAISEVRDFILHEFGNDYIPVKPNYFKSRKGAQEAHEAIRPTSMDLEPKTVSPHLSKDQLSLYTLIWKRFIASQMNPAILDQTQAEIKAGKATFKVSGSVILFKGFTILYEEGMNDSGPEKDVEGQLPPLKEDQPLNLIKLEPAQHFTQPPPRFNDATLIKALEENGIGRPSTYAAILANISEREYVSIEKKRFKPTELGFMVTDILVKSFPEILDITFTAQMESNLDKIERGEIQWTKVMEAFYDSFLKDLEKAEQEMKGEVLTDIKCPECNHQMVIKSGRNGLFLACSTFPECKYTADFTRDEKGKIFLESNQDIGKNEGTCDLCGRPMVIKRGKFGPFIACSGYPECRNTRPIQKGADSQSTHVPCPKEGCHGTVVEKTSRKGRKFYACDQYPQCNFAMWDEPFDATCPECGTRVLSVKRRKNSHPLLVCREKECGFTKSFPSD